MSDIAYKRDEINQTIITSTNKKYFPQLKWTSQDVCTASENDINLVYNNLTIMQEMKCVSNFGDTSEIILFHHAFTASNFRIV